MYIFKNSFSIYKRVFGECVPKIGRQRYYTLSRALVSAISADGLQPELIEEHDKMFVPENKYEKIFWESCRDLAKKDMKRILDNVENGKKGGRPVKNVQEIISSASPVGKNQILITEDFNNLPDCEYFNAYKKEFSSQEIKNIVNWLKKNYLDKKVDYDWIGKQLQKFRKRKTGRVI